jgi:Spc24 subunit of Ndc80
LANEAVSSAQAVKEMEREKSELETRVTELHSDNEAVARSQKELRSDALVDAPKVLHSLGLYKNISRVKWDYDSPTMKGVITHRTGVYPFNYPEADYDSINSLWDLIASAGRSR